MTIVNVEATKSKDVRLRTIPKSAYHCHLTEREVIKAPQSGLENYILFHLLLFAAKLSSKSVKFSLHLIQNVTLPLYWGSCQLKGFSKSVSCLGWLGLSPFTSSSMSLASFATSFFFSSNFILPSSWLIFRSFTF